MNPALPYASAPDSTASWKVAGCSTAGSRHLRAGGVCEDSCGWLISGDLLAVVVADGAGSAAYASTGSAIAVRAALLSVLQEHLNSLVLSAAAARLALISAFHSAIEKLCTESARLGVTPGDLACTLIAVVVGPHFVCAGQVGDGAVVVSVDTGQICALTAPRNGEFANETALLGCGEAFEVTLSTLTDFRVRDIAVFTDGLQRLALQLPACTPHAPFFVPLFALLGEETEDTTKGLLVEFLQSAPVARRTDDDTTLVLARFL